MSFNEKEFGYLREIESQKKKNNINELIINQLKNELEKYAYKVIQMQEEKEGRLK